MATTAATPSFHQTRVRASHQAIGVPTTRSTAVVIVASSSVRRTATQTSGGRPSTLPSTMRIRHVTVFLDNRLCFGAFEEVDECRGRRVLLALRQQHCTLSDRLI